MAAKLGAVRLAVETVGPPDAPVVVFVHGWSQRLAAWHKQLESDLAEHLRLVAFDLRGHGGSDAPHGSEHDTDWRLWADDLASVIGGANPVVVAWSYGGFVVSDYIRHHGAGQLAGICFVAASVNLDDDQVPRYLSPDFAPLAERAASDDPAVHGPAMEEFVRLCTAEPLPTEEFERALEWNMTVRPDVRRALGERLVHSDDLLAGLELPVLVIQGTADPIVLPATATYIADHCPTATVSWYEGIGHAPMLESPERFNADLTTFVASVGH